MAWVWIFWQGSRVLFCIFKLCGVCMIWYHNLPYRDTIFSSISCKKGKDQIYCAFPTIGYSTHSVHYKYYSDGTLASVCHGECISSICYPLLLSRYQACYYECFLYSYIYFFSFQKNKRRFYRIKAYTSSGTHTEWWICDYSLKKTKKRCMRRWKYGFTNLKKLALIKKSYIILVLITSALCLLLSLSLSRCQSSHCS